MSRTQVYHCDGCGQRAETSGNPPDDWHSFNVEDYYRREHWQADICPMCWPITKLGAIAAQRLMT